MSLIEVYLCWGNEEEGRGRSLCYPSALYSTLTQCTRKGVPYVTPLPCTLPLCKCTAHNSFEFSMTFRFVPKRAFLIMLTLCPVLYTHPVYSEGPSLCYPFAELNFFAIVQHIIFQSTAWLTALYCNGFSNITPLSCSVQWPVIFSGLSFCTKTCTMHNGTVQNNQEGVPWNLPRNAQQQVHLLEHCDPPTVCAA